MSWDDICSLWERLVSSPGGVFARVGSLVETIRVFARVGSLVETVRVSPDRVCPRGPYVRDARRPRLPFSFGLLGLC